MSTSQADGRAADTGEQGQESFLAGGEAHAFAVPGENEPLQIIFPRAEFDFRRGRR